MQTINKLELLIQDLNHQEILIAFADQIGLDGIEQTEAGLIIHSDNGVAIYQYIETIVALPFLTEERILLTNIPNENWNKSWESSFQPIRINDFCGVRASFHEKLEDVAHEIIINPELAFGTGHHETTYLMIEQMQYFDFQEKLVFDYGCGTAILSILAEQLGARNIDAIDIEEQAIKCAHDCLALNSCSKISLKAGTLEFITDSYDIILANINRTVLLESADKLLTHLNNKGVLLLSGVLKEDLYLVKERYVSSRFRVDQVNQKGEWCTIILSKS